MVRVSDPEARHSFFLLDFAEELGDEIRLWYAHLVDHGTLTDLAYHVGGRAYNRGDGRLLHFSERNQRFYLRWGVISLCKLLCRDVEREREHGQPVIEP